MKAFQLNDHEIWAGNTVEEAVAAAQAETGEEYSLDETRQLDDDELDRPLAFDIETTETTTLREVLAEMDAPGLLAATDL
jgi:hypothetical protein